MRLSAPIHGASCIGHRLDRPLAAGHLMGRGSAEPSSRANIPDQVGTANVDPGRRVL